MERKPRYTRKLHMKRLKEMLDTKGTCPASPTLDFHNGPKVSDMFRWSNDPCRVCFEFHFNRRWRPNDKAAQMYNMCPCNIYIDHDIETGEYGGQRKSWEKCHADARARLKEEESR